MNSFFLNNKFRLKLFKSKLQDKSLVASRIPQLKETVSTQHTKIYAADDRLILSGANLEKTYFTNRQDRYIEFNSSKLVDFFANLAETIGEHSWEDDGAKLSRPDRDSERLHEDLIESFSRLPPNTEGNDTVFYPNVQAGWSDVKIEVLFRISKTNKKNTFETKGNKFTDDAEISQIRRYAPLLLGLLKPARANHIRPGRFASRVALVVGGSAVEWLL